jgi:hypothetical protein
MRPIKIFSLLMLTFVISTCSNEERKDFKKGGIYPNIEHFLLLSFQDTSGNNLVEGIGVVNSECSPDSTWCNVQPDLYSLEVIYPESAFDIFKYHLENNYFYPSSGCKLSCLNDIFPTLTVFNTRNSKNILEGDNLAIYVLSFRPDNVEMLTYMLSCPYIFGDDKVHEIVSYWRTPEDSMNDRCRACYRVVIDGKEFTELAYDNLEQNSLVSITLEK